MVVLDGRSRSRCGWRIAYLSDEPRSILSGGEGVSVKRWQRMALVVAAVGALPLLSSSCGQRSLVLLDVRASTAFTNPAVLQDVRLTVVANHQVTTRYPRIRLSTTSSYEIGMYLPSDMTGTVSFEATIDDGNCIIGAGTATANGVQSGETTAAIPI